jgi:hypothetical protein
MREGKRAMAGESFLGARPRKEAVGVQGRRNTYTIDLLLDRRRGLACQGIQILGGSCHFEKEELLVGVAWSESLSNNVCRISLLLSRNRSFLLSSASSSSPLHHVVAFARFLLLSPLQKPRERAGRLAYFS